MDSYYSYTNAIGASVADYNQQKTLADSKQASEDAGNKLFNSVVQPAGSVTTNIGINQAIASGRQLYTKFQNAKKAVQGVQKQIQDGVNRVNSLKQSASEQLQDGVNRVNSLKQSASESVQSQLQDGINRAKNATDEVSNQANSLRQSVSPGTQSTTGASEELTDNTLNNTLLFTPKTLSRTVTTTSGEQPAPNMDDNPFSSPRTLGQSITKTQNVTGGQSADTPTSGFSDSASSEASELGELSSNASSGIEATATSALETGGEIAGDTALEAVGGALDATGVGAIVGGLLGILGIAGTFAPAFEHHPQSSPIHPLNPSSQFGSSQ